MKFNAKSIEKNEFRIEKSVQRKGVSEDKRF